VRSTEVVRYRVLKLRQQPQIRWCWRRWACPSPRAIRRYPLAETASRLDNLGALPFDSEGPEADRLYSSGHT
jgi:hypothetical protein